MAAVVVIPGAEKKQIMTTGQKVLLVDDEADVLLTMRMLL